jgi:hypothetical protein
VISTSGTPEVRATIADTVREAFAPGPPLLRRVPTWRGLVFTGYYLFIATIVLIGMSMAAMYVSDARAHGGDWRSTTAALANTALSSHWLEIALRTLLHHPWLGVSATIALALLLWAESRLDRFYSAFWHKVRPRLKSAL